ncbi:MAG: 3'-5' exonuclease [Bacteroidales bacterium]|nr:3'-5' exonuclease [Bacteroidales bacterium]
MIGMPIEIKKSISKEDIAQMEIISFPGEISVIENIEDAAKAVDYLCSLAVIGFDTETKPAFKKGQKNKVALLQLSGEDKCFLFRLNIIGFPECLKNLLRNPEIIKVGLSLKDDYATMQRLANFTPAGFIELQKFVQKYDIEDSSLQKIFAIIFNRKISKSQRVTNWEAIPLTEGQKKYAATDAWACLRIYHTLLDIDNSI